MPLSFPSFSPQHFLFLLFSFSPLSLFQKYISTANDYNKVRFIFTALNQVPIPYFLRILTYRDPRGRSRLLFYYYLFYTKKRNLYVAVDNQELYDFWFEKRTEYSYYYIKTLISFLGFTHSGKVHLFRLLSSHLKLFPLYENAL